MHILPEHSFPSAYHYFPFLFHAVLTSKILQRIKDTFGLRMTWNLGVIRLIFRVDDGGFELHRRVPYDYDSEFQDLYMKIASALCDGHITIHEALNFQTEVKEHVHTARFGVFLRDFPGRLIVYPGLAATCAVIFFSGSWRDAGIAALCGAAMGMLEWFLCWIGGEAKVLIDIGCGTITGIIGGLFYRFGGESSCLSSIFLGSLYWYFYGTAFVLGLLEIIAGELETGVTRFMAVSIKTFVLCLGASFGLLLVSPSPADIWLEQMWLHRPGSAVVAHSSLPRLFRVCSCAVQIPRRELLARTDCPTCRVRSTVSSF